MKPYSWILLAAMIVLNACSPSPEGSKIATDQREVLDKAKQVDNVVQQQATKQSQTIDQAAGQAEQAAE